MEKDRMAKKFLIYAFATALAYSLFKGFGACLVIAYVVWKEML